MQQKFRFRFSFWFCDCNFDMVRLGSDGVCELWRRGVEIESVCIEFGWRSEEDKQRRRMMKRFFEIEFGS